MNRISRLAKKGFLPKFDTKKPDGKNKHNENYGHFCHHRNATIVEKFKNGGIKNISRYHLFGCETQNETIRNDKVLSKIFVKSNRGE